MVYCCSSSTSLTFQRSAPVKGFVADIRDDGDAFQRLALEIPDSVTSNAFQAVAGCRSLKSIENPRFSHEHFVHARD